MRCIPRPVLPRVPRPVAAGVLGLFVLALLWAQLLGLAHGVRHGLAVPAPAHAHVHAAAAHAPGLLAHLLAPASEEAECRLYDQLGHAAPLPALAVFATAALPVFRVWTALQCALPAPRLAYAARAPPASR